MNEAKNPFDDIGNNEQDRTNSHPRTFLSPDEKDQIKELRLKGVGVNEIAREMKRSPSTISKVLRSLKISKLITVAGTKRLMDNKLRAFEDLKKIHNRTMQMLDTLKTQTEADSGKNGILVLKACEGIRKDLELFLRLCEVLYNVEEVARWQSELMDVLGEMDPDARERFYRRLQERRPV
jgi:hypothetical protein